MKRIEGLKHWIIIGVVVALWSIPYATAEIDNAETAAPEAVSSSFPTLQAGDVGAIYRNEPRVELQGDKSEIHHGSLLLEVYGSPPTSMEGHYWTDRGTRGTLKISGKKKQIFDTYESASAAFS